MQEFEKYLPQHWRDWLREFSLSRSGGKYSSLDASLFQSKVRLLFVDGSQAFFDFAFYAKDSPREEIAVFTEHCGYHVFSSRGLQVEQLTWDEHKAGTDDDSDADE